MTQKTQAAPLQRIVDATDWCFTGYCAGRAALEAAASPPAALWIACDDRMPDNDDEVLVWHYEKGYATIDSWHMYREDPTGMSTTNTIEMGYIWRESDPTEISHWKPIDSPGHAHQAGASVGAVPRPTPSPSGEFMLALNVRHPKCHEAAKAFWDYWEANGETHKHGYYESTWGAINRAIRLVGVVPHTWSNHVPPQQPTQPGNAGGLRGHEGAATQAAGRISGGQAQSDGSGISGRDGGPRERQGGNAVSAPDSLDRVHTAAGAGHRNNLDPARPTVLGDREHSRTEVVGQARAERAAVPAASTCEHCQGKGVIFTHAEGRDDDLCALNGDMHSCVGQLIPCECAAVPANSVTDQMMDLVDRLGHETADPRAWEHLLVYAPDELLAPVVPAEIRAAAFELLRTLNLETHPREEMDMVLVRKVADAVVSLAAGQPSPKETER